MTSDHPTPANTGMPRWLVVGIAAKLVLVTLIIAAVVWWAGQGA